MESIAEDSLIAGIATMRSHPYSKHACVFAVNSLNVKSSRQKTSIYK